MVQNTERALRRGLHLAKAATRDGVRDVEQPTLNPESLWAPPMTGAQRPTLGG